MSPLQALGCISVSISYLKMLEIHFRLLLAKGRGAMSGWLGILCTDFVAEMIFELMTLLMTLLIFELMTLVLYKFFKLLHCVALMEDSFGIQALHIPFPHNHSLRVKMAFLPFTFGHMKLPFPFN